MLNDLEVPYGKLHIFTRFLFEIAEDDVESGFDQKGMQDPVSPSTSSGFSYNMSVSSFSNTSGDKQSSSEEQAKKKGIPLTISAQVCGSLL